MSVSPYVLVIEDEPALREVLVLALRSMKITVVQTENGQEAVDFLSGASSLPCLILTDGRMPVMDGVQFNRWKRRDPDLAGIPIFLLTSDALLATEARPEFDVCLVKPYDLRSLLNSARQRCLECQSNVPDYSYSLTAANRLLAQFDSAQRRFVQLSTRMESQWERFCLLDVKCASHIPLRHSRLDNSFLP